MAMPTPPPLPAHVVFDRALLLRRLERATGIMAAGAAPPDFLLERSVDDLADRLSLIKRTFANAAVVGALDGRLGRALRRLANIGQVVELERSPHLLARCDGPRVLADEEVLPLKDAALDLVTSALSLHYVNDLPGTLAQIRRALKPDGLLLASLIGGRTLHELRAAFLLAEAEIEGGASPRVAPFADVRDFGALLQRAGFALPVADTDIVDTTYATPLHLMHELRAMGATNVLLARRRTPLRRQTLLRACAIYQERYGRPDGRVPATFEIITLTGWVPDASQQQPLAPGSARTRLADALRVPERSAGETSQ